MKLNLTNFIIGLALFAFGMWHPLTRKIILVILPLGRGFDDLLFILALICLVIFGSAKGWIKWNKMKTFRKVDRDRNTRVKQSAWLVLTMLFVVFSPFTQSVWPMILYGRSPDPSIWITLLITLVAVIGGWRLISFLDRRKS
jgi:membrane protease YdiL (CAAX protease family)